MAWYIAKPEGFWGFTYFIEILRVILFSIPIFIILLVIPILFYNYILEIIKNGVKGYALIRGLGFLVLIILIIIFKGLFTSWAPIWFTNKMADKYSYINRSNKLINKGEITEAFEYAADAYKKVKSSSVPSNFFILSKLYSKSAIDKNISINELYGATINYAYCHEIIGKNTKEAERLYYEAITLIETDKHFIDKQEYLLLPLGALAYLKQDKGSYREADDLFFRLENISKDLSGEDAMSKINGLTVFLTSRIKAGDLIKAKEIVENILVIYNESDLKKNSVYKSILLLQIDIELKLDQINHIYNT